MSAYGRCPPTGGEQTFNCNRLVGSEPMLKGRRNFVAPLISLASARYSLLRSRSVRVLLERCVTSAYKGCVCDYRANGRLSDRPAPARTR